MNSFSYMPIDLQHEASVFRCVNPVDQKRIFLITSPEVVRYKLVCSYLDRLHLSSYPLLLVLQSNALKMLGR